MLQLYLKRQAHHATHHQHHSKFYNEEIELPFFQEFLQLYQQAEASGQNFIDPDFKPDSLSLFEPINSVRQEQWAGITWGRPRDFLQGNFYIFHSESEEFQGKTLASVRHRNLVQDNGQVAAIDIDDIVQGRRTLLESDSFSFRRKSMKRLESIASKSALKGNGEQFMSMITSQFMRMVRVLASPKAKKVTMNFGF